MMQNAHVVIALTLCAAASVPAEEKLALASTAAEASAVEITLLPETATPLELFQPTVSVGVSSEPLSLLTGKSTVVTSEQSLKRVSVTDPNVASATIVTPNQVLIHGHLPGGVTLILWDEQEQMQSYQVDVELDLTPLRRKIEEVLSSEHISASASGSSIVLTGMVSSADVAERAIALAQTHAETVVNLMVEKSEQVMLRVRFAEVDRVAIKEYGFSLFSTGAGNTPGVITTGQFGQTLGTLGALPADITRGKDPDAPNLITGSKEVNLSGSPATFGLSDLLNVFLFRPDIDLGVVIRALQQRNLLEILAEPNLVAQNGRDASFLAGGEFPFPVVQGISGGLPAVTIQFREFGIRLSFTPTVSPDGTIGLKILQEVSALDFGNALTVSGFVVPALSTRKAETEVQLRDGQSFAIAGLLDNRLTEVASKIPGIGDIPIIGKFFTSKSLQRSNQELVVLITPELATPVEVADTPPGPEFPKPFLGQEDYDDSEFRNWPWDKKPSDGQPNESTEEPADAEAPASEPIEEKQQP